LETHQPQQRELSKAPLEHARKSDFGQSIQLDNLGDMFRKNKASSLTSIFASGREP
jgi:hypothetical protein